MDPVYPALQNQNAIYNNGLYDTTPRRKLKAELMRIDELIKNSTLNDEMTQHITMWRTNFSLHLNNANDHEVLAEFIKLLQELFIDPITYTPLDEEALLGSDGKTYGKMSLALYMHSIPEHQRNRSPFNPQNPALFSTMPHPIVRHMTNWLKERQALLYSEEIERRYQELMEHRRLANPQNERMDRIRHIQEIQQQRDLLRNFAHLPQIQQVAQGLIQDIQGQFQPLHQQLQRNDEDQLVHLELHHQQHQEQLNRLEDRAQEFQVGVAEANNHLLALQNQVQQMDQMLERRRRIQNILQRQGIGNQERMEQREALAQDLLVRQQVADRIMEGNFVPIQLQNQQNREANLVRLQAIEQNDQAQAEVLRRQIQRLQRNVEALDLENLQLQNQIGRVDIAIREAEKDDARLQISINETRKAVEERNSGWLSEVLSVVISIGACALATWALQGLGAAVPIPGGAKLNLSIKF